MIPKNQDLSTKCKSHFIALVYYLLIKWTVFYCSPGVKKCYYEKGCRVVYPYFYVAQAYCLGSWAGKHVNEVYFKDRRQPSKYLWVIILNTENLIGFNIDFDFAFF